MEQETFNIEELSKMNKGTLMEQIGIEYLEARTGYMKARMPVDERTFQPMRILHGGATLALAETLASIGSALMVDREKFDVKGQHISADHVRSVRSGWVVGEAVIVHRGRSSHIWNVDVKDEEGILIFTCRLTIFVVKRRNPQA
ncbi:MAG: thioesterase [bacterium]|nr:MAG: thioesterase [bacterium]